MTGFVPNRNLRTYRASLIMKTLYLVRSVASADSTVHQRAEINMTTSPFETPLSQDAPSPGATAVATRTPFGTDPSGNEAFLAVAQNLSHTGSFGWSVASGELDWSAETFNIFEHDRAIKPSLEMILSRIHPDDRYLVQQTLDRVIETDRKSVV